MNKVQIVINAELDQEVIQDKISQGYTDANILAEIRTKFNALPCFVGLVKDFEVDSVEVKE